MEREKNGDDNHAIYQQRINNGNNTLTNQCW